MTSRRFVLLVLIGALSALVVTTRPPEPAHAAAGDQDLVDLACGIPHDQLVRTWNGWRSDRGAQLSFIPKEPNFVGSGLPHVGPWDYIQTVPMLWYGPGIIKAQKPIGRPVTSADIAPTEAEILKFDGFDAPDGEPMSEALEPTDGRPVPKLLVTMVWDAGGMNVLQAHPKSWPFLKSLMPKGSFFSDMTVGSSPTSTAQIHATIGTGSFPRDHGIVGHNMNVAGTITGPWNKGPAFLVEPTLADVYDEAMNNEPVVGLVATVDIHFGMLGHGSFFGGGDRDIALTRSVIGGTTLTDEGFEWNLPERVAPYYRLPNYANDVKGFEGDVTAVDQADGKLDGKWRDNDIEELLQGFDTPARTPYLLFLNFKEIDFVSHVWSMNSPEMDDAVVAQDAALKHLVTMLNTEVGKGNWVMALTADHASMPDPAVSGGYQISSGPMQEMINTKFDDDGDSTKIVDLMQPSQAFLNLDELEQNGYTVDDVARYVMTFTQAQTAGGGVVPNPGEDNDTVMAAAFPSAIMLDLPCLPEAQT
jgi:Type I phosphodiesterase / nucleotide pyrophosphatase